MPRPFLRQQGERVMIDAIERAKRVERAIVRKLIRVALADGLSVTVNDGGSVVLRNSVSLRAIEDALGSTGEDVVWFSRGQRSYGYVFLVWGNGVDVISDNSNRAEPYVLQAFELAEHLCDKLVAIENRETSEILSGK